MMTSHHWARYVAEDRERRDWSTLTIKVEPEYRALHRVADRLAPELKRAFLRAVEVMRDRLDPQRLMALLRQGDAGQLGAFWRAFEAEVAPELRPSLRETFLGAADPTARRLGMRFDLTNPRAVDAIDAQAGRLIRDLTAESQAAIRLVIRQGFTEGLDVPTMARRIRESIGLTERYARAVANYRRAQVQSGTAPGLADQRAARYRQRLTNLRATTIARTETITAANAGQQAAWSDARQVGRLPNDVRQVWIITPDDRLCPICEEIPGLNPDGVPLGGAFRTPEGAVLSPPAHPSCRCAVGLDFPEA